MRHSDDALGDRRLDTVTVGVVGQPCRADVSPWGDVTVWGGAGGGGRPSPPQQRCLRWFVAAEDRWHDPSTDTAVRQHRPGGVPVTETRLRVPDGDAVQYVWSVPDRGGVTVVEVTNDSPLPFAVAFSGTAVLTDRQPSDVRVRGIELPEDAFVMPVGHHSTIRVGIPHDPDRWAGRTMAGVKADRDAVAGGWAATAERAGRFDLPEARLVTRLIESRCDLLLAGPVAAPADPVGFLLDVGLLVRLGEPAEDWLPEIVAPIESIARSGGHELDRALLAAHRVAIAAGDRRASGDIGRLQARRPSRPAATTAPFSEIAPSPSAGRFTGEVERRLATEGELLPMGIPTSWLGIDFEVHDVPIGVASSISYAVRWHGERPAVLWERSGDPLTLSAPAIDPTWSSDEASGEALWAAPTRPARRGPALTVADGADAPSFR